MSVHSEIRIMAAQIRRWCVLVVLLFSFVGLISAQGSTPARKLKSKVAPVYPELARKLNLVATVKVEVLVGPAGAVVQAKALGGHPLLVDPSVTAAKQCRFEPTGTTTTTILEFHFAPGAD